MTITTRKCKYCGKEFTPSQSNQVYCSEICANRQYRKNYKLKLKHGFIPFSQKSVLERTRTCPNCGNVFVAHMPNQKYCCKTCKRDCYRKAESYKESTMKIEVERMSQRLHAESKPKKGVKRVSHIDDDNAKARALGMSYGKYKAMVRLQALHDDFQRGNERR